MSHTVYLVGTVLPQPTMSEDAKPNLSVLGCFNDLQDAKDAIGANAMMVANNPDVKLTIYKVNLGDNVHYTYHKKDLQGAIDKLQASAPRAGAAPVNTPTPTPQQNAPQQGTKLSLDDQVKAEQAAKAQQSAQDQTQPKTQQPAQTQQNAPQVAQTQQKTQQPAQTQQNAPQVAQTQQKTPLTVQAQQKSQQSAQTQSKAQLSAAEQQDKVLKQQAEQGNRTTQNTQMDAAKLQQKALQDQAQQGSKQQ